MFHHIAAWLVDAEQLLFGKSDPFPPGVLMGICVLHACFLLGVWIRPTETLALFLRPMESLTAEGRERARAAVRARIELAQMEDAAQAEAERLARAADYARRREEQAARVQEEIAVLEQHVDAGDTVSLREYTTETRLAHLEQTVARLKRIVDDGHTSPKAARKRD